MSESSIFGDLDIEGASDNPFGVDEGVHECTISKVTVGRNRDDNKTGMTIVYTITDGDAAGLSAQEWKTIREDDEAPDSVKSKRNASFLKLRLREFGIADDKMNSVTPDDLIGIEGYLITGAPQSNGFPVVKSFSKVKPGSTDVNATQGETADNPFEAVV